MANVKGSKISSKLEFVRRHFGEDGVETLLQSFPESDRRELRSIIDLCWYPFALYDAVLNGIVRTNGHGDDSILDRIGAHSAEHQLNNIYAAFKRDELLRTLKNMVPMHSHLNDPGHMDIETGGNAVCTIIVSEPRSTASACRVSRAFYKRVAELAGARRVQVVEPKCTSRGDAACRFEITAT